ncbi:MAG TPA: NUDIX hydrolase [Clostridia bacterium]|nr:NUDIX hydrolase [Clostridia bacterium]
MDIKEKTVTKNYVYRGRIIKVRNDEALLPNGKPCLREVIEHNGGASVLAIDKDNHCYLVRQFRYPFNEETLEIPAGKLEVNEDPKLCALRELTEETGLLAPDVDFLCKVYPTPGYSTEIIYIYLAKEFIQTQANPDEDEFLNVVKLPLSEAKAMAKNGEIKDAKTVVALLFV